MSSLPIALVGVGILAAVGIAVGLMLRQRRHRDSVETFSAATSALRHMAEHPPAATGDSSPHPRADTPNVHVLDEVGVVRLNPSRSTRASARARRRRPDPDAIARRPTIASLPSISSPKPVNGSDDGREA